MFTLPITECFANIEIIDKWVWLGGIRHVDYVEDPSMENRLQWSTVADLAFILTRLKMIIIYSCKLKQQKHVAS